MGLLGRVVQGWQYLSAGERKAISYRVAFAVGYKDRYWQLVESDRMAPIIIGEG